MTIRAICLATCFIAMDQRPPEYYEVLSSLKSLSEDVELRIEALKVFQRTTKWKYESDMVTNLESSINGRVNPTLIEIKRRIADGTHEEDAISCYKAVEREMMNLSKEYINRTMTPCLSDFRSYVINSLVGIPELIETLDDTRTQIDELIESYDQKAAVQNSVGCQNNEHAKLQNETLGLLDVARAFTDNMPKIYSLAEHRFTSCMSAAGAELEVAAQNLTNDGTRCP